MRLKICRKEAKETAYFLWLIYKSDNTEFEKEDIALHDEGDQLKKYFLLIEK